MAERTPDYELCRRVIEILEADDTLVSLLFPDWAPNAVEEEDKRIYNVRPNLGTEQLQVLPRIIIETMLDENPWEQNDLAALSAPVRLWTHVLTPNDRYDHCEAIDARIRTIIGSTYLTNSRIIASELVPSGSRRRVVEREFNDANRLSTPYTSANVGVLV